MACGCSKNKTTEYVYTTAEGKPVVYPTELKARVAQIRAGNTGTITPRQK